MRRANYVRHVKSTISNTFGKVFIGDIPGYKTFVEEIKDWKSSSNVLWAKNNCWNQVKDSSKEDNTYMNHITSEVFKVENLRPTIAYLLLQLLILFSM